MNRDVLWPALARRVIATVVLHFVLVSLKFHPCLSFALGYAAVAVYQWVALGGIVSHRWPRFTMSALWPVAYLYATGED